MIPLDRTRKAHPRIKDDRVSPHVLHREDRVSTRAHFEPQVLVACPDARPPAFEAAAGFASAGMLDALVTGYHFDPNGLIEKAAPTHAKQFLARRSHAGLPPSRVIQILSFDLALAVERRAGPRWEDVRRRVARWRTERFDLALSRLVQERRPDVALFFSDVASELAGPLCQSLGIPTILSMVHGVVQEEREILSRESERSPEAFRLYLGETMLNWDELNWLHERRLRDLEWADLILVPSEHIAAELSRRGVSPDRIRVVPYAADTRRFRPAISKSIGAECTFLFAGGIAQRKGICYLLQAWQRVRRPGWRLQLLGAAPRDTSAIAQWLDGVEVLGRVPHSEVPARMAAADVFVFPSLFEGSAVVTYEAMACGLPSIVTTEAGSIVRDGVDGLVTKAAEVDELCRAMEILGREADLRAAFGRSARLRAETHDWPRYHSALKDSVEYVHALAHGHDARQPKPGPQGWNKVSTYPACGLS
jgi:glycosyltransferase involved in cell wall biosynthesis